MKNKKIIKTNLKKILKEFEHPRPSLDLIKNPYLDEILEKMYNSSNIDKTQHSVKVDESSKPSESDK